MGDSPTVDAAEVGRYGTIRLMKRNNPEVAVASFPVDDEVISFGRNPDCSVRLYYSWVSGVHCTIIFKEHKAFLQVLGTNGVLVDGCYLFPAKSNAPAPTTVPLVNSSIFEIHKKRFQFTYPPKELRKQLYATPATKRRRTLRLSMIESANVFTPTPSANPAENLRVLQSPLRTTQLEDTVTLVDGNNPTVVEEQGDLVILEDVSSIPAEPVRVGRDPTVQRPLQQYNTPPRRRSALSLHRAVLIRSAQRAAIRQETMMAQTQKNEENDELEEYEVEEAVSADLIEVDLDDEPGQDITEALDREANEQEHEEEMENYDDDDPILLENPSGEHDIESMDDEEQEEPFPLIAHPKSTRTEEEPSRRHLGAFMTPQPSSRLQIRTSGLHSVQRPPPGARVSLGFSAGHHTGGVQRVRVDAQPWKIEDIVLPVNQANMVKKEEDATLDICRDAPTQTKSLVKLELTEAEKRAIRERRKSAMTLPDPELSFVPGTRRTSVLPSSPIKKLNLGISANVTSTPSAVNIKAESMHDEEDDVDAKTMLERMKDTVEGLKKRQSLTLGGGVLGWASSAAKSIMTTPSPIKARFSLLASPSPLKSRLPGLGRGSGFGFGGEGVVLEETFSQVQRAEMEEGEIVENGEMLDEDADKQNSNEQYADIEIDVEQVHPVRPKSTPPTPRMDGIRDLYRSPRPIPSTPSFTPMRDMFRASPARPSSTPPVEIDLLKAATTGMVGKQKEKHPDEAGVKTPNYDGVRKMYLDVAKAPERTPDMRGMKTLYGVNKVMPTPDYGGLDHMMHIEEPEPEPTEDTHMKVDVQADEQDIVDVGMRPEFDATTPAVAAHTKKRTTQAPRATTRRKGAAQVPGIIDTPADLYADDEATPGVQTIERRVAKKTGSSKDKEVPEAAIVRRGRSRKVVDLEPEETANDIDGIVPKPMAKSSKTPAKRSKSARAKSVDAERAESIIVENVEVPPLPTKIVRKTRVKAEPAQSDIEDHSLESADASAGRRAKKPISTKIFAVPSRTTRARSRSVDVESVDDPLDSISESSSMENLSGGRAARGARPKPIVVEAIAEEAEEPIAPAKKPRARGPKAVKLETSDSEVPLRKAMAVRKPPITKSKKSQAIAAVSLVSDDEDGVDDKENFTTDVELAQAGTSLKPVKASAKAKAKTPGRTMKGLSESSEEKTTAPRATRAKARK